MRVTAAFVLTATLLAARALHGAEPEASGAAPTSQPARRVALFPIPGDARLQSRLTAELQSQGFLLQPATLPATSPDTFEELQRAMRRAGAALALRIVLEPPLIRLWIINATTGKELYREVESTAGTRADGAVVSLWAVEALRASELSAVPSPAPAARPPRVSQLPKAPRASSLHVGPALLLSPGGVGTSVQVAGGARRLFGRWGGMEVLLVVPTLPARLERSSGSAAISRGLIALGPFLTSANSESRVALDVAAGAALVLTRVSGAGAEGFVGQTEQLVSASPYARVGGSAAISSRFRLRLDAASGIAFPRPTLTFAEEQVAAWGRPWFLLWLGGEVSL